MVQSAREVVAVFHDGVALQSAIDTLLEAGFDRAELSLMAGARAIEEKLGGDVPIALVSEADAPDLELVADEEVGAAKGGLSGALIYVGAVVAAGAVVATGGILAAALAAGVAGAAGGGALGLFLGRYVEHRMAGKLEEQLDRGGLLLWVNTRDAVHEDRALDILRRSGGDHVEIHDLSAAYADVGEMKAKVASTIDEAADDSDWLSTDEDRHRAGLR